MPRLWHLQRLAQVKHRHGVYQLLGLLTQAERGGGHLLDQGGVVLTQ